VPIGFEVAKARNAPLDTFIVRKLGVPGHAEFAMGAIASGGVRVANENVVRLLGIGHSEFEAVAEREGKELQRRELLYRSGHSRMFTARQFFLSTMG
jgi:putative phosphoribosyl transferase